jgi:hypothetical protein
MTLRFEGEDGRVFNFQADKAGIRKWFCNSSLERAKKGVPASYKEGGDLWTDEWHTRCAGELLSGTSQLSHHFC